MYYADTEQNAEASKIKLRTCFIRLDSVMHHSLNMSTSLVAYLLFS
jgi:hypothetical protein